MKNKNIKFESKIDEQLLMEHLLNCRHSGVSEKSITLILIFHAFANSWNISDLLYYLDLLEVSPNDKLEKVLKGEIE